jgi:adenosyl cobinamide kinase/adenosyl cobinamide phosphate guanylyltransferase
MPSIFVWKADQSIMTSTTMKYYSGSNWFLEEIGEVTRSMLLIDSMQSTSDVIAYHAQRMPQNWVGSEVLEIMEVSYQLIKEDDYAVLEQLGDWLRCTLKQEFSCEFAAVQEWMAAKKTNNACLINFNITNVTTHHNKINHTNGKFNHAHHTMVKA